jgi:hypothetical protein
MRMDISKIPFNITIGFMYWLNETHNLRGLKDYNGTIPIEDYPNKLKLLKEEYDNKYSNGLDGWNNNNL